MVNSRQIEAFSEVALHLHLTVVTDAFGDSAIPMLKELLTYVGRLYHRLPEDVYRGQIVVVKSLDDSPVADGGLLYGSPDAVALPQSGRVMFQTFSNGAVRVWSSLDSIDLSKLAQSAIVYTFDQGKDTFFAGSRQATMLKLVAQAFSSNFGVPRFHSLKDALEDYRLRTARHTGCKILEKIWFDSNRIFFIPKPESLMRDSLVQFLNNVLGSEAQVRPEQNVNETEPVDIFIHWYMSQHLALIEVKWMGKSHNGVKITTEYGEARANHGAKQLADYLDENYRTAPLHAARAYLIVFDARRANTAADTRTISRPDGLKFENREITFQPAYHVDRLDFEVPLRFFCEPKCDA